MILLQKFYYIFINTIPRIIKHADKIFLGTSSFSFNRKYATITFSITSNAHNGATILTFPSWYDLNIATIDNDHVIAVISMAFLLPFLNSCFIYENLILSNIKIITEWIPKFNYA